MNSHELGLRLEALKATIKKMKRRIQIIQRDARGRRYATMVHAEHRRRTAGEPEPPMPERQSGRKRRRPSLDGFSGFSALPPIARN